MARDALDKRQNLRIRLEVEHVPAPAAPNAQHVPGEHQALLPGLERALLEPVGGVIDQFAGGLDRAREQGQKMLFDEVHVSVVPLPEQVQQFIEIIGGGARGGAQQNQEPDADRTLHHQAAAPVSGSRQKSKKLNQLYGSVRQ